jgi:hypothetical protein
MTSEIKPETRDYVSEDNEDVLDYSGFIQEEYSPEVQWKLDYMETIELLHLEMKSYFKYYNIGDN